MKFRFLSLITLIFFGATVSVVSAASSDILVNIAPPNPDPYEETIITLNSYAYNLDSVLISWSQNGKVALSGIGKKSFSVTAPAAGAETNIVAKISLPDGVVETKITIKPSVMVLLWQANDSYVPPFYRGKAMPSLGSEIKVVAMPEISALGSSESLSRSMTYYWKKDYTNNVDGSGYGKNFFIYTNDYLEDSDNINVVASTLDQKYSSQASIDIGTTAPKILFYKNDSDFGTIWEQAIPDPYKIQTGETIEAVPYFISPKEIQTPTLVWKWFINDGLVNLQSFRKNLMPLQVEAGTHGTSKLRLEIESKDKIFQTASKEINIEF